MLKYMQDEHPLRGWTESRNLSRQYDYMNSTFLIWQRQERPKVTVEFICDLNFYATHHLSPAPGHMRSKVEGNVDIQGTPHTPPNFEEVDVLMATFFEEMVDLQNKDPFLAAAFALWRLNWIHPFMQGNGRTARALSYFLLCQSFDTWFPGDMILPEQIRKTRGEYVALLQAADSGMTPSQSTDLSTLAEYLKRLLIEQLKTIPEQSVAPNPV